MHHNPGEIPRRRWLAPQPVGPAVFGIVRPRVILPRWGETLLAVGRRRHTFSSLVTVAAVTLIDPVSDLERRIRIMLLERTRHATLLGALFLAGGVICVAGATQLQRPETNAGTGDEAALAAKGTTAATYDASAAASATAKARSRRKRPN
jgi:hypothetical protein